MKLILHIGRPKTASSTIQRFVATAANELASRSYHVPEFLGRFNHRLLAAMVRQKFEEDDAVFFSRALRTQADRRQFIETIERRLINWLGTLDRDATVIMTCEQLSSFDDRKVAWLHAFCEEHFEKVEIVTYIRRQDLTYVSRYNTGILSNRQTLFSDRFAFPQVPPDSLFHGKLLDRWADRFGSAAMNIRCLDPEFLMGESVPLDFCSAVGLDPDGLPTMLEAENRSISIATIEFVRQVNERLKLERLDRYEMARIGRITQKSGKDSVYKGERLRPARSDAEAFYEHFKDDNERVARTYLNRDRLFSDDMSMYPEEMAHPTQAERYEAAIELVTALLKNPDIKL